MTKAKINIFSYQTFILFFSYSVASFSLRHICVLCTPLNVPQSSVRFHLSRSFVDYHFFCGVFMSMYRGNKRGNTVEWHSTDFLARYWNQMCKEKVLCVCSTFRYQWIFNFIFISSCSEWQPIRSHRCVTKVLKKKQSLILEFYISKKEDFFTRCVDMTCERRNPLTFYFRHPLFMCSSLWNDVAW